MRPLTHNASFAVWLTAILAGFAALLAGARVPAGLCVIVAVAAYTVGWFTTPEPWNEVEP